MRLVVKAVGRTCKWPYWERKTSLLYNTNASEKEVDPCKTSTAQAD